MNEAARSTLSRWHNIVAQRDLQALPAIVHPEAVFRSPVAHTPYPGAFALCLALNTVIQVFEDFTYHREFLSEHDNSAVLEFSATVNGKSLKGIDMIRFDEAGQISEIEVMIRPKNALEALATQMGDRIGDLMTTMKEKV